MHYPPSELKKFWKSVERLRKLAKFSHAQMADLLIMTDKNYEIRNESKTPPNAMGVLSLTKQFNLDPRNFVAGNVDWDTLVRRLSGHSDAIPERYNVAAFSRRRTSNHVLSYLDRNLGSDYVSDLLNRFDLTERVFSDPDAYINLQFLTDLCDHLTKLGLQSNQFKAIGYESARINKNLGFSQHILESLKIKDVYAFLVDNLMGYFDRNYKYRVVRLTETSCIVEAEQNQDVADALGKKAIGSTATCQIKAGVGASFPMSLGLPVADVRETKCVHRGDPICTFEFNFENSVFARKRGLLSAYN